MRYNDVHCHLFSSGFLELLTREVRGFPTESRAAAVARELQWEDPGTPEQLADRWVAELDRHGVSRAALIASLPGDEETAATAVQRHPARFVGCFMFNPAASGDVAPRLSRAFRDLRLRMVCLFPAMHKYRLDHERVVDVFASAAEHGAAVFAHCGALTVGVRAKLGLASPFDWRLGDPLALASVAVRFPSVPVIVPHFGAGYLREALMAADQCANIHLDSSSSNAWMKYYPHLALADVFRQAIAVAGAGRIVFGTDSSFFPRGWQHAIRDTQKAALDEIGIGESDQQKIFADNFDRLFADR